MISIRPLRADVDSSPASMRLGRHFSGEGKENKGRLKEHTRIKNLGVITTVITTVVTNAEVKIKHGAIVFCKHAYAFQCALEDFLGSSGPSQRYPLSTEDRVWITL